jgi:hypothetical protein
LPHTLEVEPTVAVVQFVPIICQIEWTERDIALFKAQLEAMAKEEA